MDTNCSESLGKLFPLFLRRKTSDERVLESDQFHPYLFTNAVPCVRNIFLEHLQRWVKKEQCKHEDPFNSMHNKQPHHGRQLTGPRSHESNALIRDSPRAFYPTKIPPQ